MERITHPITPPPELVQQWREAPEFSALSPCVMVTVTTTKLQDIATQAAQWGTDQELKACCEWLVSEGWFKYEHEAVEDLHAALRAAADQLAYEDAEGRKFIYVPELLAIAAELEGL